MLGELQKGAGIPYLLACMYKLVIPENQPLRVPPRWSCCILGAREPAEFFTPPWCSEMESVLWWLYFGTADAWLAEAK